MKIEITAKRDKAYVGEHKHHYTIGTVKDAISGGFYINKGTEIPEEIVISIKEGKNEGKA